MQNLIQKFRQSSIVFEKPGILSENSKTLTSSNYPTVQYFLLKLSTRFLLTNVYKRVSGIFFMLFRSWFINKNVKRPGFYTLIFTFLFWKILRNLFQKIITLATQFQFFSALSTVSQICLREFIMCSNTTKNKLNLVDISMTWIRRLDV